MPHWQWLWSAEIEPFPSAVMAERHPESINLGDVTAEDFMQRASAFGQLDVLCAGSPCQSFSLAGLRKGLDDPRGNLTLRFLAIVDAMKPRCVLWENVPGILSDKDDAFGQFLDGLEELGYIYDVDILDAQWHGLAQRRRRVFVCAHRLEDILQQRTITSALTVIQLLTECLLLTLAAARPSSMIDLESLAFNATEPRHSLQRRIRQFGMDSHPERVLQLAAILDATLPLSEHALSDWDWDGGSALSKLIAATKLSRSTIRTARLGECQSTERSWLTILGAIFQTVNECITSTAKNPITELKIFGCAKAIALINALITPSMASQPTFWSAALSTSTAMKAFTDYARQTTSDLFADPELVRSWLHFIRENERSENAVGDIGVECFGEVLPVSQSLCGNPAPRREKGQGTAHDIATSLTASGRGVERGGDSRGQDPVVAVNGGLTVQCADIAPPPISMCLNAGGMGSIDAESETLIPVNRCGFDDAETQYGELAGTLTSRHDSSPCADRGQNIIAFSCKDYGNGAAEDLSPTLRSMGHAESHANGGGQMAVAIQAGALRENPNSGPDGVGVQSDIAYTIEARAEVQAVAFAQNQRDEVRQMEVAGALAAEPGMKQQTYLQQGWQVRRLTPTECARLQGFPDDHCAIDYRGKPAADGPIYKAYGNSWAVPVGRWILERIERFMPEIAV